MVAERSAPASYFHRLFNLSDFPPTLREVIKTYFPSLKRKKGEGGGGGGGGGGGPNHDI